MFGLNRTISIYEVHRPISNSGSIADEIEELKVSGVKSTIQSHILNNLPPPADRQTAGGIFYLREFRCWIPVSAIDFIPRATWIVEDETTGEKYRIRAVIDDGGRSHHYLLRMENYDG